MKIDLKGSYLIIFLYFSLCLELLFISAYLRYLGEVEIHGSPVDASIKDHSDKCLAL